MPFRQRLRDDLIEARKARDSELVSLIRTLIAAVDNAEAVDPDVGNSATEVPRRDLSDDQIRSIIANEGAELRHAADDFVERGNHDEAHRLRTLSAMADRYAQTFDDTRP